jgi:hypothetical protein
MKKSRDLILDNFIDDYSQMYANETFKIFKQAGAKKEIADHLLQRYLSHFIENMTLDILTKYQVQQKMTEDEAYRYTKEAFLRFKSELQTAISNSFERAFYTYVGKKIEYYCLISPVPEVKSNETQ